MRRGNGHLKRATPRMLYQHMRDVVDLRREIASGDLAGEKEYCARCGEEITSSRPLWMVGHETYGDVCQECCEKEQEVKWANKNSTADRS